MRIVIDGAEVVVFTGARVKDAVLKHSDTAYKNLLKEKLRVLDLFGNRLEPDGALCDGQQLYTMSNLLPANHSPKENHA